MFCHNHCKYKAGKGNGKTELLTGTKQVERLARNTAGKGGRSSCSSVAICAVFGVKTCFCSITVPCKQTRVIIVNYFHFFLKMPKYFLSKIVGKNHFPKGNPLPCGNAI